MKVTRKFLNEAIHQVLTEVMIRANARSAVVPGRFLGILSPDMAPITFDLNNLLDFVDREDEEKKPGLHGIRQDKRDE